MNSTMGVEEEEVDLEQLETLMTIVPIIVPILFTFVIVIGFVGNLLVVLVVLLNKTKFTRPEFWAKNFTHKMRKL